MKSSNTRLDMLVASVFIKKIGAMTLWRNEFVYRQKSSSKNGIKKEELEIESLQ